MDSAADWTFVPCLDGRVSITLASRGSRACTLTVHEGGSSDAKRNEGLSVVDLGVSKISARGDVKNLKKLEDFPGTYTAAAAGGAVGGGAGVAALKNQQGVEMALIATTQGVKFALAGAGVTVKLKK